MKSIKIILAGSLLVLVVLGSNSRLLSWGLFNLFTDTQFSEEGLKKAEAFNPDTDILYLPSLKDKDLFQATGDLSICNKKSVRKQIYLYLTSGRAYLIRSIERSYLHADMIREIFKKNKDIPENLSMLPLLESGFDPRAVSASKAVGLWQFVDNTARPLGLVHNRWLDERRSVEKSTLAALQHLRNMRRLFPSWELALAAYNGGAGYIKQAMTKSGAQDFWSLRESGSLREETAEYVPKFIALLLIYKNQRLFGIRDEITIPEKQDTEYFTLEGQVDLHNVSRLSSVALQTIQELNPELNHSFTPSFVRHYRLSMPVQGKKKLQENAKELYRHKISGMVQHRVRKGDTIIKIARIYNNKSDLIIKYNRIKNPDLLQPGRIIYVPY